MRPDEVEEMRSLPLLRDVAHEHVTALLKSAFLQRFPAHVELVREGDPADFLHVIVEGQVDVFSAYGDRETTIAVLGPGESFIVAAVLLDRVYLKSARALTSARILLLPAEIVRKVFDTDFAFARSLGREIAVAYRSVVKELKNQKLRSSLERLANWLIIANDAGGGTGVITLPFDKKVLAARLGMAPEVLSRSFAALQPYHVVVEGPQIRLMDVKTLLSLARPSPTIDHPES